MCLDEIFNIYIFMDIKTLPTLPPLILSCSYCRKLFLSFMRMNLLNYKTCNACRVMKKLKRENK